MLLLPMLYLPPLSYMALLCAAGEVQIEAQEAYTKGTYRNKCEIIGANGKIALSIPIAGGRDHHRLYREAQISYIDDWQHRHWMSIVSCYSSSPFYEHYIDHFRPYYETQHQSLFEYNRGLLQLLIKLMKLDVTLCYSEQYEMTAAGFVDLRKAFKSDPIGTEIAMEQKKWHLLQVPYMQVFGGLFPFSARVTALDLLFNAGPESRRILRAMIAEV